MKRAWRETVLSDLRRWAVVSWFLWLGVLLVPAGASDARPVPYTSRIWQTDDGLPQNSVYAITQTRDGYLWVGTHEGLARFDGVRFRPPEPSAPAELRHGWIVALCAGQDGSLWIASETNGVVRLHSGVYTSLTEACGLPSNQARCLLTARDGTIWIGTEGGLARYQNGELTHYSQKQGLGDPSVRALWEDRQGVLHIATRRGLSSLSRDGVINTVSFSPGWVGNALRCVMEDRQRNLWVGSTDGLFRVRDGARETYGLAEGLPHKIINTICEDRDGQVWLGTYGGLVRMAGGKVLAPPEDEPVYCDLVYAVFEDREANLWVGARDGLYRLNPARFTTYTARQGLAGNNAMSVCEDRAGTLWIATWDGGVSALRGDRLTVYNSTNGLTSDSALSLHEGRDGSLWIGLEYNAGLNRFRGSCQNSFPKQAGLLNAAVRAIHEDRQGSLWIGTSAGLNVGKEGQWATYTTTNGLPGEVVLAILEDRAGDIWLGIEGGLSRWHQGHFTNYTTRDGLAHNAVGALYEDQEGTLWIGTRGGGLNRFKEGRFSACSTKQGLFSDEIYELIEDDVGYFWMSCRKGLFRVARRELERFFQGDSSRVSCTVFGKSDGLLSVQFNGVAKPSGCKSHDGRLWFPTIRGVVAVESHLRVNEQPPPVVIEEVLADRVLVSAPNRQETSLSEGKMRVLRIPPGRGELEVHFTALSFQAPEKNRFRYRLENVDSEWVEAGSQRVARYNHIGPGTYRFHVIACNNDGVWNQSGPVWSLVMLPHFWQTWWFKASLVAALGLGLASLYRLRVARLRALENLRIQIAANLHDDVGARLTKVAMVTEFVECETADGDRIKPHVQTIAATVREIIQAMDEIVWTINPKNDNLDNLANYIFQYAQDYFQDTGVRCRLDLPPQLPDRAISTESRHNLFMAVKEALNNVLKHSRANEVRIGLTVADNRIELSIVDDGKGFQLEQANRAGNGLQNMRQRLQAIGGQLVVRSQPGHGTVVRMEAEAN